MFICLRERLKIQKAEPDISTLHPLGAADTLPLGSGWILCSCTEIKSIVHPFGDESVYCNIHGVGSL